MIVFIFPAVPEAFLLTLKSVLIHACNLFLMKIQIKLIIRLKQLAFLRVISTPLIQAKNNPLK